ncbi:MAG TPA: translocation/assembly module TamB domain-containing protein [Gemmatimonadales bacterium]
MLRRVGRLGFALLMGALATIIGMLTGLTATGVGRDLLARVFTYQSSNLVEGRIEIRRVSGTFLRSLFLDSVVVRDTSGVLFALLPRVEAEYSLGNLLGGRILLTRLRLDHPRIHVRKHRDGRLNLEEILGIGAGPTEGRPPLLHFRDVTITDGIVTIQLPWSPPGHLRTDAERDSALQAQRLVPGRRIEEGGREGLIQMRTVEGIDARFSELRLSTPDRDPIRIVVDSLTARMNDPMLVITDARGEVTQARDTLWFTLERLALPRTRLIGEGLLAWPQDTLLYNFKFDAPEVALADLRFVSPDFPDLVGSGRLAAFSVSGLETQYDLQELVLADAVSRVEGALVARSHRLRRLGFRDLDLQLTNLDLEIVRPYLDTLPLRGRLSGRLRADGFFEDIRVDLDWTFADSRVAGMPPNHLAMDGLLSLGGPEGIVFRETRVSGADLDLATVRLMAPAVILEGRMQGEGTLDGPWRDVVFRGRLEHRDGARPQSMASGRFGLDTRGELTVFDTDIALAPLDFEGIRRTFPTLPARGQLWGPVQLRGPLDSLFVQADLQGDLGRIRALGTVAATPPRWGADSLWLGFENLDLALLRGRDPPSRLTGEAVLRGVVDSAVAPEGSLRLVLAPGEVREFLLDSARADVAVRNGVIMVDTTAVHWAGGSASAKGTLGWASPDTGTLRLAFESPTLAVFDSLLDALAKVEVDTAKPHQRLEGSLKGQLTLTGSLDALNADGAIELASIRWKEIAIPQLGATVAWKTGDSVLQLEVRADSLRYGPRLRFGEVFVSLAGPTNGLEWRASAKGPTSRGLAWGRWGEERGLLALEGLELDLGASEWRLGGPVRIQFADSVALLDPLHLSTRSGSAVLDAEGTLPWRAEGELDIRLLGLDLRDIYALRQRDTAQVSGYLQSDLRITGSGAAPVIRGTVAITGPVFGDFRGPLARGAVNYRNQRLDANLTLWRTGHAVMEVGATLPLELAWRGVEGRRQLPGELAIRARADSMDLAALEAFSPNLRRVRGVMLVDVAVSGTWETPRLGGGLEIRDGAGTVPTLGVSYGPVNGTITFTGDSLLIDTLHVGGETGRLDVEGLVRLQRLTTPVLHLAMQASGFRVMDVPEYMTLEATGDVRLEGPLAHPVLTGSATARNSVIYFSDLVVKQIVNLEDPLYADLVDLEALRRRRLGAQFQSRFLDSLTIRNLRFVAADRVWLRSNEANFQLEGSVTVNKVRQDYRLEGTFNTPRGTYTLNLWPFPVTRTFEVVSGQVRYFNTPDLDAALDVQARHIVKYGEAGGQDVAVTAHITGTLQTPRLTLESTIRPALSGSDIVGLLLVGRPINTQVAAGEQAALFQVAWAGVASALTSEIERSLLGGAGIDVLQIRPGVAYSGISRGTTLTRLSAGWQLGDRWFLSLNAGFCPNFSDVGPRSFGFGIELRTSRSLLLSASAEPVQICLTSSQQPVLRYQLGTDIRWIRER